MTIDYHQHNWVCRMVGSFDDMLLDWLAELPDEDREQICTMSFARIAAIVAAQAFTQEEKEKKDYKITKNNGKFERKRISDAAYEQPGHKQGAD